jgi:tight adherence protein B
MELMAALSIGLAVICFTLYLSGYGMVTPLARLERLRRGGDDYGREITTVALKRKASLRVLRYEIKGSWTERTVMQLERAGLQWKIGEYMAGRIFICVIAVVVAFIFVQNPLAIFAAIPAYWLVGFYVKRRMISRTRKIESQLVEAIQLIANALRAGFGLMQGLETAARQVPDPLAMELKRTLRDVSLGASLEQALENLNHRIDSADLDIAVTAVLIQRQVGGNLAEILDTVANTMRERERIKGEIRTLTAQQRLTGWVIGLMPVALAVLITLMRRDYLEPLFTETLGLVMLAGAVVMQVMGLLVIKKITDIEV